MAKFEVKAPNGKLFEVNAPEGSTEDQAIAYIRNKLMVDPDFEGTAISPTDVSTEIPVTEEPVMQEAPIESGYGSDFLQRIKKAEDIKKRYASGETSLPSATLQGLGNVGFGLMGDVVGRGLMTGLSAVTPDVAKEGLVKLANTEIGQAGLKALQAGGQQWEEWKQQYPDLIGNVEAIGNIATGLPAGMAGAVGAKYGLKAGKKAGDLALEGTKQAGELAGKGIQEAVAYPVSKILPQATQEIADVARLAKKYNIPTTVTEITKSPAMETAQKVSSKLISSGEQGFRNKQMKAWNKALLETVGVKGDKITPANMDFAFAKVGKKFDEFGKGKVFNFDDDTVRSLRELGEETRSSYGAEVFDDFMREGTRILKQSDPQRNVKGEILNIERSRINKLARKAEPNRAGAYKDLEDFIIEIMAKSPEATKEFSKTKQQYKNLIILESLSPKARGGDINPTLLANRVNQVYGRQYVRGKAGEIGELARVGYELLPIHGGSDTLEKGLYTLGAAGVGGFNPVTVGAGLGANRIYQELINRNPALVRRLIEKGGKPLGELNPPAGTNIMNYLKSSPVSKRVKEFIKDESGTFNFTSGGKWASRGDLIDNASERAMHNIKKQGFDVTVSPSTNRMGGRSNYLTITDKKTGLFTEMRISDHMKNADYNLSGIDITGNNVENIVNTAERAIKQFKDRVNQREWVLRKTDKLLKNKDITDELSSFIKKSRNISQYKSDTLERGILKKYNINEEELRLMLKSLRDKGRI